MPKAPIDPRRRPFPEDLMQSLRKSLEGAALEDALRAAHLGNYGWLGMFLESVPTGLPAPLIRRCLDGGADGLRELYQELTRLEALQAMEDHYHRIMSERTEEARSAGLTW